jgi:hypothetical protein
VFFLNSQHERGHWSSKMKLRQAFQVKFVNMSNYKNQTRGLLVHFGTKMVHKISDKLTWINKIHPNLDLKKNINLFLIKSFVPHHEGWHLNGFFHKFSKQNFSKLSNNISNTFIEVIWLSSHHLNDWERFWQCRSLFKDVVLTWINKFILNFFK